MRKINDNKLWLIKFSKMMRNDCLLFSQNYCFDAKEIYWNDEWFQHFDNDVIIKLLLLLACTKKFNEQYLSISATFEILIWCAKLNKDIQVNENFWYVNECNQN